MSWQVTLTLFGDSHNKTAFSMFWSYMSTVKLSNVCSVVYCLRVMIWSLWSSFLCWWSSPSSGTCCVSGGDLCLLVWHQHLSHVFISNKWENWIRNMLVPVGVTSQRQRAKFIVRIYRADGLPRFFFENIKNIFFLSIEQTAFFKMIMAHFCS